MDGGKFTISGCTENKCKLPKQVVKFKALHCDGFVKPSDCGITCAPGYNSKDNSIFKICKQNEGEFELIGCTPNICHFPSNLDGYDIRNCMGDLSSDKYHMCRWVHGEAKTKLYISPRIF